MIVYKIVNSINGKIYVGQDTFDRNFLDYFGSGKLIKQAVKKYGIENFVKDILAYCYSQDELNAYEIFWTKELNSKAPNGYNITDGGGGTLGFNHSEETKQKISFATSGKNNPMYGISLIPSEEHKRKIGESHKGKPSGMLGKHQSEETKKKISIATFGKNNPMYKKPVSEETRQKISKAQKGRTLKEMGHKLDCQCSFCKAQRGESKNKNHPMYGKNHSEESKEKISKGLTVYWKNKKEQENVK